MALPSGVSTDSGWNCTPSAGQLAVPDGHHHVVVVGAQLEQSGRSGEAISE